MKTYFKFIQAINGVIPILSIKKGHEECSSESVCISIDINSQSVLANSESKVANLKFWGI
jgi:hypothetical protein